MEREQPAVLLARGTRTMKQCSFDARSEGQPATPSVDKSLAVIYSGLMVYS